MTSKVTRRISIADWQNSWMGVNFKITPHFSNFVSSLGPSGKMQDGWQWYKGKKVLVFREATVLRESVLPVIRGIKSLVERIGLDIRVIDLDADSSIRPAINYATRPEGVIDGHALGSYLIEESSRSETLGGFPHADVLITDRYLALGRENWGQSEFSKGYMVISLPGGRQRCQKFITNIAMHETGHLLGYQMHHDTFLEEDLEIEGYPEVNDCLMFWRASTREICPRCKDAIKYLWQGLQQNILPSSLYRAFDSQVPS